jgi:hypothetical protein
MMAHEKFEWGCTKTMATKGRCPMEGGGTRPLYSGQEGMPISDAPPQEDGMIL